MNKITSSNNIQFTSLNLLKNPKKKVYQAYAANVLNQEIKDIVKLTKHASSKRISFFNTLAENYNIHNFYRAADKKENSELVTQIYSKIKRPNQLHSYIIKNFSESFETINKIFENTKNSKKNLTFVKKVNELLTDKNKQENTKIITQLLESPFRKKYVKHYDDIKPYLILNKDNPDSVKNLDDMFQNGTFMSELYKNELSERNIKKCWNFQPTDILNADVYYENYSIPLNKVLNSLCENFLITNKSLQNGSDKYVLDIIHTTNKKNADIRQKIINTYGNSSAAMHDVQVAINTLKEINKLFTILDNDKHAKNFVQKSMKNLAYAVSLNDLNDILTGVSTAKLDIFRKNAIRIIAKTTGENRINALKDNIKNPFFETPESLEYKNQAIKMGYCSKPSFTKNIIKYFENYFNVIRSYQIKEIIPELKHTIETTAYDTASTALPKPQPIISKASEKTDKKSMIKESVLDFVSKKLGVKTFDRQKAEFADKATKMRFSMLPEIFSSIADTRKTDRAIGKKRINSSNADALNLYSKINGNNKKLINYMLKKRNADNTRMFEVKEIINTINKAEKKIKVQKETNPNYRARDARKYYNHLYEAKIQQYGKLTKPKTKV